MLTANHSNRTDPVRQNIPLDRETMTKFEALRQALGNQEERNISQQTLVLDCIKYKLGEKPNPPIVRGELLKPDYIPSEISTIRIPRTLCAKVDQICYVKRLTRTAWLREAVAEYLRVCLPELIAHRGSGR